MENITFDLLDMHRHGAAFYDYLRMRKRVFVDELGWDIPHNDFVECWNVLAEQPVRQFIPFSKIRNLVPNCADEFHRAEGMIVPYDLVHLLPCFIELDELDHWRAGQLGTRGLRTDAEDAKVREAVAVGKKIMFEQFLRRLFLDGGLHTI